MGIVSIYAMIQAIKEAFGGSWKDLVRVCCLILGSGAVTTSGTSLHVIKGSIVLTCHSKS
jgi:hypothetical protein